MTPTADLLAPMRFAYADPPYFGCGARYKDNHAEWAKWNTIEAHADLINHLAHNYPDGWALSLGSNNLQDILPLCPKGVRVGSWVKPFASFKPNVNPAYAWEPVIFTGGRKRDRRSDTIRDYHSENITLKKGLCGAKPAGFALWIAQLLGADASIGDTIDDLFPGTGGMLSVWKSKGIAV